MRRLLFFAALFILIVGTNPVSAQATITVIPVNDVRLFSGPDTKFDVLAKIPAGTALVADARSAASNWVHVIYNNLAGWVYTSQLRLKGNLASLPIGNAVSPSKPTATPPQGSSQPQASDSSGNGAPQPPPNGAVISLEEYAHTDHVNYYRLTYWSNGLKINGYFAEPRSAGKYPAVIYNRGGWGDSGKLDGSELAPFAEAGFVAVGSQYRGAGGSEGGDEFGGADLDDVLNLIPFLMSRPYVDPNRIVMFGSSRGGMMTYLALKRQATSGGPIKAAVTVAGVADLFMWGAERPDLVRTLYAQSVRGGSAALAARSATYWPDLIQVPLLIEHGSADSNVSVKQSQALYKKLKAKGATVELGVFPGGDHALTGFELGLPDGLKWFQKWVGAPGDNFDYYYHRDAIFHAQVMLRKLIR